MEYRSEHAALRCAPGIAQSEIDLQQMLVTLQYRAIRPDVEPAQVVLETIDLRRHAGGPGYPNHRRSGESLQKRFIVDLKPPHSSGEHGLFSGSKQRFLLAQIIAQSPQNQLWLDAGPCSPWHDTTA